MSAASASLPTGNVAAPRRREPMVLLTPAAVLLGVFFFLPLVALLLLSFFDPQPTLAHYQEFLSSRTNWIILGRTFALAIVVTGVCLVLGYPLAYWIATGGTWASRLLMIAVVLPFFTSYLVRTYAWMVLLGRFGLINQALMGLGVTERPLNLIYNEFSVVVAMVYMLMPFTVLVLVSVMKGIPPALTRAAASLGASPSQNFWRVFLPLSAPGVISAGLLVFVFALGFYITPALLGGPKTITLPMLIDVQVNGTLNWPLAAAIATVLLVLTLVFYAVSNHFVGVERLLGSAHAAGPAGPSELRRPTSAYVRLVDAVMAALRTLGRVLHVPDAVSRAWDRLGGGIFRALSVVVALFLISPILIIVPMSFSSSRFLDFPPPGFSLQWYQDYLQSDSWIAATWQSVGVGIAAAVLSLVVGTSAAMALVRSGPRMRRWGYQLLLAPMIVPVIISAVGLYFLFAKLQLVNTSVGLVLAHSVGAIPLVVLIVAASLQAQNVRLEHAAASLGASRVVTIRRIVLPLIRPALAVGGFFAFLHSFDEVVLSLFISGPDTMTLPVKMWSGIREEISPTIAAVSTLMIGFTIVVHVGMELIRKAGARRPA